MTLNPKSEIRNPKQTRNPKSEGWIPKHSGLRGYSALAALSLAVLLSGCFSWPIQHVIWSPDGSRAAVLDNDGDLSFCDAEGKLVSTSLSNVFTVAWQPNSQGLIMLRMMPLTNWAEISPLISDSRRTELVQAGDRIWSDTQGGKKATELIEDWKSGAKASDGAKAALTLYMVDRYGKDLQTKVGTNWAAMTNLTANATYLQAARINGDHLDLGKALFIDFQEIASIRLTPDGNWLAYVAGDLDIPRLYLAPVDGSRKPAQIAPMVALGVDWSPDSRSVYYVRPNGTNADFNTDVFLASLSVQTVRDFAGGLVLTNAPKDLAGLIFDPNNQVHCLPDGRVVFTAHEITLPSTADDMPSAQRLFVFDPRQPGTLSRLIPRGKADQLPDLQGDTHANFEFSPDGSRISFAGEKGDVQVFTLATADLTTVQAKGDADLASLPSWRTTNELCLVRPLDPAIATNQVVKSEVVLWKNGAARVISQHWPTNLTKGLLY